MDANEIVNVYANESANVHPNVYTNQSANVYVNVYSENVYTNKSYTISAEFLCDPRGLHLRMRIIHFVLFHVVHVKNGYHHLRWKRRGKRLIFCRHCPYHKPLARPQVISRMVPTDHRVVIKMVSYYTNNINSYM